MAKLVLNSSDSSLSHPVCHLDRAILHISKHTHLLLPPWHSLTRLSEHNCSYIILSRAESPSTSFSHFQYQEICLPLDLSLYASCCSCLQSSEYTFLHHQTLPNSKIRLRMEPVFQGCFSIM